jgi:hypothetical protein
MTTPAGRHELIIRPQYRLITLRDVECLLDPSDPAIDDAANHVAGASPYVLAITAAQDLVPVRVVVEIWPTDAPEPPAGWATPLTFDIECPTGQLVLGDGIGTNIDGINPPQGPGHYTVQATYRGRDRALTEQQKILDAMTPHDYTAAQRDHDGAGSEEYLIRMWYDRPVDQDDE